MTGKRFELNNIVKKGTVSFWDNEKETILNASHTLDKLNELSDKCEFLEIENESLEDGATRYAELYHKSLKENEQLKEKIEFIFEQIKAFREDCRTYQDFDGASTITQLIKILDVIK